MIGAITYSPKVSNINGNIHFLGSKQPKSKINVDEYDLIKPKDIKITDEEKAVLIEKIIQANELARKNLNWGNITKRGYATNVGLDNGNWYLATNFNNTRNNVSSICGERSAIVGAYNDLLKSKPLDNPDNLPLDFKIKFLAMSSHEPLGTDDNADSPCVECLSWFDTTRYFSDDTLIASIQNWHGKKPALVLYKLSDFLPQRNEVMKYPTCSIESAKVDCSSDASRIMRKKGINKEFIRKQVLLTKKKYDENTMANISGQNSAASIFANGKFYTGQKTDFSKRWNLDPLEMALAKAVEINGSNTMVDAICYVGDETKENNPQMIYPDKIPNLKVIGEMQTRFADFSTLVIKTKGDEISVKTIADYMPPNFQFIQGYKLK